MEANHIVFPISDVITEFLEEDSVSLIVCIEVHIECVDLSGSPVVDYDYRASDLSSFAG